jgi:hypothetical protein
METRHWFRIALVDANDPPRLVAASGAHAGEAIAVAQRSLSGSWPIALERASGNEIPLGESVGKGHVVPLGEADVAGSFRWPVGVLPSLQGAAAVARAGRGFTVRAGDQLVIEAQTDAEHLTDLFLGMIERLPSADNLEVRLLDHFDEVGVTDVWLTSRVDARRILRFLDDHDDELLGNGHLELSIYLRKHKATLRLTEHKTVVWLAEGHELEADVIRWLGELAVPRVDELVTVGHGPHFHYRPAKSRDRKKLGEELYRQRLRVVDHVRVRDTAG